jgi:O-antigen/teichoic acid export membrane protein
MIGNRPDGTTSRQSLETTTLPEEGRASTRNRILRNVSALGLGQIFTWIASAGLIGLLPRYLGDENLGKFTAAVSLTDLCGLIAGLGITDFLIKEVAREGEASRSTVLNALAMRLPLILVACGLAALATVLLGYDALTQHVVLLLCINVALSSVGSVLSGVLQGMQEMRWAALIGAVSKGAVFLLVWYFLVVRGDGVVGVALAWDISNAIGVAGLLLVLCRRRAFGGHVDVRTWRPIFVGSIPFAVWQSALMVYGQVGVILLSLFASDAVVGWHGAAFRIIGIPIFVPVIIASAVFPVLSQSARRDLVEFRSIAQKSLEAILVLTVPMTVGTMAIAEPLLGFLHYPPEFRGSIPSIMILAAHIPLVGAGMIIGNVLNALDRQRLWATTGVVAAVLNPGLNLILIPLADRAFENGAIGVAISTFLTELFMIGMGLWLVRGRAFDRRTLFFGLKCVAASLMMAGVVWALPRDLFLPIAVIIGGIAYLAISLILGTISRGDIRLVRAYVLHRQTGPAQAAA